MPGKEHGFEPPRNWDGKLKKAPNSHKKGYPHKDGSVWVPTGRDPGNPNSHSGPHWDVEYPSGRYGAYHNVLPDGTKRKGKK
ncbi:hypothetical protein G9A89_003693 [Geosiphon pyriformis]|nr:hypothetical protein G9A89_003693 [Geosiphon pyriformis]